MLKKEARKIFKARREELSSKEREVLGDLLLIRFQSVELPMFQTLFSYWPAEGRHEPPVHLVTRYLEFRIPGLRILYPKTDFTKLEMVAIEVNEETDFVRNEFQLDEPESGPIIAPDEIDIIIVPLLAFDLQGYRVGYGKGFYDKFLKHCRVDCIKVGLSFFDPVDRIEDRAEFDVPLDICITPHRNYVF